MEVFTKQQIGLGLASRLREGLTNRKKVYKSFYGFVKSMWDVVVPEDPVWNWHIKVICQEMQEVAERVYKGLPKKHDLLINIPPGSTKSTICSVMFPAWVWTRMPTARTICGSYAYQLAMDLSRKTRDIVQSERYQELVGGMQLAEDQNTKGHFVNHRKGGRFATSTGGAVTGFHAHFIVIDDPLNPKEAVSELELKGAHDWIGRTLSTRKVDKKVTPTILIMQRLHEDDPSARMIEDSKSGKRKIRHLNLPAEVNSKNRRDIKPRYLKKKYKPDPDCKGTKLLDPKRMDRATLDEFKQENVLGEYGYAGQMLQRPVPLGGGMFKTGRIVIEDSAPAKHKLVRVVRFWDKAGTEGGGAYTVGVLMAKDTEGYFWVLDVQRDRLDTGAREELIEQIYKADSEDVYVGVEQEPGSGGKESAEGTIRNLAGAGAEAVRPTGDKVVRAIPFSSQVNSHNVKMVQGEWNREYLNELSMFPFSKFKDQVDASSGAFTLLNDVGARIGVL